MQVYTHSSLLFLQEIISYIPGMIAHVVNLLVLVMIPMVVIQVKSSGFSLSK